MSSLVVNRAFSPRFVGCAPARGVSMLRIYPLNLKGISCRDSLQSGGVDRHSKSISIVASDALVFWGGAPTEA